MIEQYVGMKDTPGVYVGSVRCGSRKCGPSMIYIFLAKQVG